jgi:hypothetical protein
LEHCAYGRSIRSLYRCISSWLSGLGKFVTTDIGEQMHGINASAYVRLPFTVPEGTSFTTLKLRIQYDDGFVAYLNGVEAARRNAPAAIVWNSTATTEHSTRWQFVRGNRHFRRDRRAGRRQRPRDSRP